MKPETKAAVAAVIDAFLMERGCSRLIAANYAAQACLDEYNRIQKDLGSTSEDCIVSKRKLERLACPKRP